MKKSQATRAVAWGFSLFVVTTACIFSPGTATPPTQQLSAPAVKQEEATQTQWDRVIRDAKTEGTVSVYGSEGGDVRTALIKGFETKYGLLVEYTTARGPETVPKVVTQRNAGLFLVDVLLGAGAPGTVVLKPLGAFDPLEPALILPEVKDPRYWYGGKVPWSDPRERTTFNFNLSPSVKVGINTDLVRPDEVSSYYDLLNPKWKGKILISDPVNPGSFTSWVGLVADYLMGVDYLRQFAAQDLVALSSQRLQVEWLARGKYPVAIALNIPTMEEFARWGAPVLGVIPKEGTDLLVSSGVTRLMNKAPHPNAARLFINWLLSKEGQTIYSRASFQNSAREDIPTDYLPPTSVRQPGMKYIVYDNWEERQLASAERERLSREIFGHLLK